MKLDELVKNGILFSTREVWNEMERGDLPDHLRAWIEDKGRDNIFTTPTPEEQRFVQTILSVRHFQTLIGSKQLLGILSRIRND